VTSLPPPKGMSPAARVEWEAMVKALGEDVAGPVTGLIEVYAQARVRAQAIARQIDQFDMSRLNDPEGLKQFDHLCLIAFRTSNLIASTLTRLKATPQTQMRPEVAYTKSRGPVVRPWGTIS
jgi:hypothetical protein